MKTFFKKKKSQKSLLIFFSELKMLYLTMPLKIRSFLEDYEQMKNESNCTGMIFFPPPFFCFFKKRTTVNS